jgi:hypothetical protein
MDDKTQLDHLEALAGRLGLTVRYEPMKAEGFLHTGGYCRVKGQDFVIVNKKAPVKDKIRVLAEALKRFDLRDLYILPSLRKILDNGKMKIGNVE